MDALRVKYKDAYSRNTKVKPISNILLTTVIKKVEVIAPKTIKLKIEEKKLEEKVIKESIEVKPEIIENIKTAFNVSYPRTIIVGSFFTDNKAQNSLLKLQKYFKNNDNLLRLQKKHKFELKVRRSGIYYGTLIEPLTSKVVLQEVRNTLRLEYKDAYVTHKKVKPISKNAPYPKTIIVGSFFTHKRAQSSLLKLQKYFRNNDNLLRLQKEHKFELKVRRFGKYYAALIEPLPSRNILQEVLDILGLKYKAVFLTNTK
jgi:hypothetical protein